MIELASKVECIERGITKVLGVQIQNHNYRYARLEVVSILRGLGVDEIHRPKDNDNGKA